MKRAIKNHLADFIAILVLIVLAIVVTGYILHNEGLRFPLIQSSEFTINAQFSNAQAVTPGQGQSVRVSGVQVGVLSGVTVKNGYAIVKMSVDPKYRHLIHTDATAVLRPKTGLQDMFVELSPGTAGAPIAKPGYTIPLPQTDPEVNVDEILSSVDADTRQYLDLLVNGAGAGLKGQGNNLAGVLNRFQPTHQDLARLNSAVAVRGRDLQQLVNSLRRLNDALVAKQTQITQLVDSSSSVFGALASEDGNISRAVADLPSTLHQTTTTLAKVQTFAQQLGPTATKLLPAAQALPAANAALAALAKPSAPIIQNQIRPFVVAARPVVRDLRPASNNLAKATPNLSNTFAVVNHFLNLVGYNPGGDQHGYLWWLAWLGHIGRTLFAVQDGNGDYRQAFAQLSCSTIAQVLDSANPALLQLYNLVPVLSDLSLCPAQASAISAAYRRYQAGGASARSATNPSLLKELLGSTVGNLGSTLNNVGSGLNNLFLPHVPTR
jgi:phospholipid/cholesterol/gamma-HCH transport system substrate-binding protein